MKFIGSPHALHKNKQKKKKKYEIVEPYSISSIDEFSIKQFILHTILFLFLHIQLRVYSN